jgi:hypothetical protein
VYFFKFELTRAFLETMQWFDEFGVSSELVIF